MLSRSQRQAGAAAPGTHTHTHTHRSAFYRMCEKGAGRIFFFLQEQEEETASEAGGRAAVRAEGRAAAFPWITSLVSQGRNLRGAPQTN